MTYTEKNAKLTDGLTNRRRDRQTETLRRTRVQNIVISMTSIVKFYFDNFSLNYLFPLAPPKFSFFRKCFFFFHFFWKSLFFFSEAITQRCSLKMCCLGPATLLKKRLRHRCSPVYFAEFLKHLSL